MNLLEEQTGITAIPKYVDSIAFNDDGHLALAASNLTGRTWNGVLAIFNDAQYAPNIPHVDNGALNESGITDIEWVDNELLVSCTDAGTVELWKKVESPGLDNIIMLAEHSDVCSAISVSKHTKQILSASWDCSIKIWDLEVDLAIHNISYHTDKVLDVVWNVDSGDVFASVSEDGTVKLFDNRSEEKPGVLVSFNASDFPTCLDWRNNVEVVAGYSDGHICVFDSRMMSEISNIKAHSKSVNCVLSVKENIVSVSNDMFVKAHTCDEGKCVYEDKRHLDYVQDLALKKDDETLWTCAWDGGVLKHVIS